MEEYRYLLLKTKSVMDFDGFYTDYSLYEVLDLDGNTVGYVCVLGDTDLYDPNEGTADFDYETDDLEDAENWFNSYDGYAYEDDEEDMYESYLAEDNESEVDQYGGFQMLDDVVSNFTGNMPEDDIDKAIKYLNKITKMLTHGSNYSDVVYYGCVADWLDPIDHKGLFQDFKQIYKRNEYEAYYGTYNGKPFIVDHFDLNAEFGMYATDESIIYEIIDAIAEGFE